jgi:penicillin-binding protein 1C
MPYDELTKAVVCRHSGHKASSVCEPVDTVYIPLSGNNSRICPYHQLVHLSPDRRFRVNTSCESIDHIITQSWFVLPPSQAYYYKNYHIDYLPLPPVKPGCDQGQSRMLDIIYPEHNSTLYLPKGFTGEYEMFVFKAAHSRSESTIYWHIDDEYLGETSDNHQMACRIAAGTHVLTLVDGLGNQRKILFTVESNKI